MHFKCGDSSRGLFRDLITGLDGTPMPSFTDALKPDQIWDLVHFIESLQSSSRKELSQVKAEPNVK
jgi:cytochrome c oxidase cbb3-type subunit 2